MSEASMVERVARAICAADPAAPEPDATIMLGMKSARAWEARVPMARAAIAAMRGADEDMICRGWYEASPKGKRISSDDFARGYQAAVDEALREE